MKKAQAKCYNCKFAGKQFKVSSVTHLHCNDEKQYPAEKWESGELTAWHSLQKFSDTCKFHEFKDLGFLTVGQLKKACVDNPYILARLRSGNLMGINTKVANIALKKKEYNDQNFTDYVGFIPCDFQTYISYKHGFC